MIRRWRTILDPERVDHLNPPTPREALAMWFLGSAWLVYGVWLAVLGLPVWLPAVPVVGVLSLWIWKRRGAIFTFPLVLVTAMTLDARLEGVTSSHLTDLVLVGTALVMVARSLARGDAHTSSSWAERVLQAAVAGGVVVGCADPTGAWPRELRIAFTMSSVGMAAWLGARRAAAHARLQLVFPWATLMLGTAVLAAWTAGRPEPSSAYAVSVSALLACTLPFAWSGASRRGRTRIVHWGAAVLGSLALVRSATFGLVPVAVLVPAALVVAAASVPRLRHLRLAAAVVFALLAVIVGDARLAPIAFMLAALAAGLVLGEPELRAPRRRRRSIQNPVVEEVSCVRRSA